MDSNADVPATNTLQSANNESGINRPVPRFNRTLGFDRAADSPPECARRSRARLLLRCDAGCSNRECARRLKVTPQTAGKWRARFLARGMQGLADQPRLGAPVTPRPALSYVMSRDSRTVSSFNEHVTHFNTGTTWGNRCFYSKSPPLR